MKVLQENGLKAFMQSILNKFIKKEDTEQVTTVDVDTIPTNNSNHLITSGAVAEAVTALTGSTAPTTSTVGYVGQHYIDTSTTLNKVYECTAKTAQGTTPETYEYTWTLLAPVQSISAAGTAFPPDANGNVTIPNLSYTKPGLIKIEYSTYGLVPAGDGLRINPVTLSTIDTRDNVNWASRCMPVTSIILDYAVKAAMTDGIGAAWTDAERLAALLRMGCTVDENGFVKWTATPSE